MNGTILSYSGYKKQKRKVLNDLLEQKYIDLVTTFDRLKLKSGIEEQFADHLVKIDELFKAEHNWDNASAIEQMLAPMYTEVELDIEIRLCLLEAQRRLAQSATDFFHDEYAYLQESGRCPDVMTGKLNLLCNLYKKLQISYDLDEQKKFMLSSIRFSTCVAFFISIFIFFIFNNMQMLDALVHMFHSGEDRPLLPSDKTEFTIAAMCAGWMGSCFSMLLRMKGDLRQQSLPELAAINRLDNLISRSLIGIVSGLIIQYAFEGHFLQGALFPTLTFDLNATYVVTGTEWDRNKAHAMLIFWCFIAGFSEKLVPDLLGKAEKKMAEES